MWLHTRGKRLIVTKMYYDSFFTDYVIVQYTKPGGVINCFSVEMLATQVLPEDKVDNASQDVSEVIGHLIIDGKEYEIRRGETQIGRNPCCSIVVDSGTVSKLHAVIECDGRDETFIYDCGSTNSTKLGKKILRPHYRYKLDDGAVVLLGNVAVTFRLARVVKPAEKTIAIVPANTQALLELDDIFDLPTQVQLPGPSGSGDFPDFRTPDPVPSHKKSPDSGLCVLENSDVFNETTQCQLPKSCQDDESEKVKALLNDGQDDVLCSFMSTRSPIIDDETEVDIFDMPTQAQLGVRSKGQESVLGITPREEEQDSIITQKFDEVKDNEKEIKGSEGVQTNEDDDLIFTQEFKTSNNEADESVFESSLVDQKEDSIVTQKFEVAENETETYDVEKEIKCTEGVQTDEDDDLVYTQKFEHPNNLTNEQDVETSFADPKEDSVVTQQFEEDKRNYIEKKERLQKTDDCSQCDSEDLNGTQIYETKLVEFSERIESILSNCFTNTNGEKSGDETESDLEITNENSPVVDEVKFCSQSEAQESHDTNNSYVFEVNPQTDSDATDCETEVVVKAEPVFEETQVLTLTPPSDFVNIPTERRSPSPRCWSQLSLEMPNTQEVETTMDRVLEKETRVGSEERDLKRRKESAVDPSPAKKPKTDGLSKLWQVHDIAQIQPTRTRRSLRTPGTNEKSCRRSARIKKPNSEITPYLIRCRQKKESPKESPRVLRNRKSSLFETPARRRRTKNDAHVIAFTGFESASLETTIHELGGGKTNDLSSASVVVADKVRRTVKFLCAIGLSLPITSPEWLSTSKREKKFVNPMNFILKDKEAEEKWGFNLRSSLERSKTIKLLEGYNVFATESTKPPVNELLAIVQCCGGTPIIKKPTTWPRKTIIVSCKEDEGAWPPPRVRNIKLVHYEFILTGVLRQKIDFKSYSLR